MNSAKNIKLIKYTNYLDYLDSNLLEKILKINCKNFKYDENQDLKYNLLKFYYSYSIIGASFWSSDYFEFEEKKLRHLKSVYLQRKTFRERFGDNRKKSFEYYRTLIQDYNTANKSYYFGGFDTQITTFFFKFKYKIDEYRYDFKQFNRYEKKLKLLNYIFENENFEDLEKNLILIKRAITRKNNLNFQYNAVNTRYFN